MWNQRYNQPDYVYGTEPNDFLVSVSPKYRKESSFRLGKAKVGMLFILQVLDTKLRQ